MKILVATSEMAPLVKTGGLADVTGALPKQLAAMGHDVAVVMPFYGQIDRDAYKFHKVIPELVVELPAGRRVPAIWYTALPGDDPESPPVTVFLVEDMGLFERPQLYADGGQEYPDNPLRFGYFCLSVIYMLQELCWFPDVIHCNDWQTALIPTYLRWRLSLREDERLEQIRILFSIHNLSYQGVYPPYMHELLGLPSELMHPDHLEFHGHINLLKGGIIHSDWINTVSPTYAREIQTPEYGCGLEGLLHQRAGCLVGILNGIDTREWDPAADTHIKKNFSVNAREGKSKCKKALQKYYGLPTDPNVPLFGLVSRLANQKGLDILAPCLTRLLKEHVQFVLLGSGQPEYHEYFKSLASVFPDKVGIELGFNNKLAHQIEAGADFFLMPSMFEPCGLNQMYSMRYGTIPIVRRTGGLADSVIHATEESIATGEGTGFVFDDYDTEALMDALWQALDVYYNRKDEMQQLVTNAMERDFSWGKAAGMYYQLMQTMLGH